ncbi:MAG: FKBP-type peptidyl-prolyl cis-trans isomerase [Deltaproteobacteria bacterium]|nr:MAG: FKBP-type peptidyl-prolyl cis-trans isomerase [Deltaproteobacteria bacterium]
MKKVIIAAIIAVLSAGLCLAAEKPEPKSENDKISYSVGYQVGGDFKRQGVELNPNLLVKGVQDAMSGAKPLMTQQEMNKTLVDLKRKVVTAQREEQKKAAAKNLAEGKKFLEGNARKEGVTTLPSGLQYKVIAKGTGASPKRTDNVTVHYKGTLIDGTEFDSSYKRGKPATFRVDGVIAGWTEALQLMKPGAKWLLFIPPNLAYGERGAGSRIGPNSALVFEVELISVQASKQ